MQYGQQPQQQQQQRDVVSGEDYRYALTNFRIAHEKVEQQRQQLEEQERQIAQLQARIATLEGGSQPSTKTNSNNSVDDFSIKTAASKLEKSINRFAADLVRSPPVPLELVGQAVMGDVSAAGSELALTDASSPVLVQNLLRHVMAETISEGIINSLIVTNSPEANDQLTRIHEHLFARDPTVASVWRRQTFSAAVETFTPEMTRNILEEHVPKLMRAMGDHLLPPSNGSLLLSSAYNFSRMLHSSTTSVGAAADSFYRSFVPEVGSILYDTQVELVKRCMCIEKGEIDRVGATIFPGLVKIGRGAPLPNGKRGENTQLVVRRAQVVCECALLGMAQVQ